jgi:hypothetical protein
MSTAVHSGTIDHLQRGMHSMTDASIDMIKFDEDKKRHKGMC